MEGACYRGLDQSLWEKVDPWIFISAVWCFTQAENMRNENTSSASLHSTINSWWTGH